MTEYDNRNRGVLFRADHKEAETDRVISGSINIDGREHWLSGWVKTSKAGKTFLSLSVKPKTENADPKSASVNFSEVPF